MDKLDFLKKCAQKYVGLDIQEKDTHIRDHFSFDKIASILAKKYAHHLLIENFIESEILSEFYLTNLISYISFINPSFQKSELYFLNKSFYLKNDNTPSFFANVSKALPTKGERVIFLAINISDIKNYKNLFLFNSESFLELINHPNVRILFFSTASITNIDHTKFLFENIPAVATDITTIKFPALSEAITSLIFTESKHLLEKYHDIVISDEIISFGITYVARYFPKSTSPFTQLCELMDIAATFAKNKDGNKESTLTKEHILNAIDLMINIRLDSPKAEKLRYKSFKNKMNEMIYGQEIAINAIHEWLNQNEFRITPKARALLFVGPPKSGKKLMTESFSHFMYHDKDVLYFLDASTIKANSLLDVPVRSNAHHLLLKNLITEKPYSFIYINHINKLDLSLRNQFKNLLREGYFNDAMIIASISIQENNYDQYEENEITLTEKRESSLLEIMIQEDQNENALARGNDQVQFQGFMKDLDSELDSDLREFFQIVPFFPLNHQAISKIVEVDLNKFVDTLHDKYLIELTYEPEVINYLANKIKNNAITFNRLLSEIHLVVENALNDIYLHQPKNIELFLHLNETGDFLQCMQKRSEYKEALYVSEEE